MNSSDKKELIRSLYLKEPSLMRDLKISVYNIKIYKCLTNNCRTSKCVADKIRTTVANVSTILLGLYNQGYLLRDEIPHPSGSLSYEYRRSDINELK